MHKHCEYPQRPIDELIAALKSCGTDLESGLKALREASSNCPACTLAAIRQSKVQTPDEYDVDGVIPGVHVEYNFKDDLTKFWANVNEAAYDEADRGSY